MGLNILNTCQEVVSQSKDVKIVTSNIFKLAEKVYFSNFNITFLYIFYMLLCKRLG